MRIRNHFQTEATPSIVCSQKDNIEREGYVSVEQSYNEFVKAGRAQIEALKKKFPSNEIAKVDAFNIQAEKELRDVNVAIRNDDLDGVDYARKIDKSRKTLTEEYTRLANENAKIESELQNLKVEKTKSDTNE